MFCVCEAIEGPMIEEYAFSFSYSSADSQEVSMNVNRIGNKQGGTFKCNSTTEITPNQMRSSACKMVRTLIQLMRTLDKMPEEPLLADIKRGSIPKSEKKNSKPDARKMSQRAIPIKNERNLTGTKKKTPTSSPKTPQIISTPKLAKPKSASAVISVPKSSVKKANSSSLPKIKNPFGGENKRAGPTSLHLSLSLGSANPSSASTSTSLTTHRKSLFMEQMGDKDIVKRAFKAFQKFFNQLRSSNDDKPHGLKQVLNKGSEQKTSTSVISQKDNDRARKTAEKINAQCYQPRRRLSSISTGWLNEGSLNDRFEKAASSSVSLRSDNRVERQKEFFKRSEVKANSNEADKRHLNSKSKEDKEAEMRKLKQSLTFKAKPMPDFYRVQGMSKNPSEKIVLLRNE